MTAFCIFIFCTVFECKEEISILKTAVFFVTLILHKGLIMA